MEASFEKPWGADGLPLGPGTQVADNGVLANLGISTGRTSASMGEPQGPGEHQRPMGPWGKPETNGTWKARWWPKGPGKPWGIIRGTLGNLSSHGGGLGVLETWEQS